MGGSCLTDAPMHSRGDFVESVRATVRADSSAHICAHRLDKAKKRHGECRACLGFGVVEVVQPSMPGKAFVATDEPMPACRRDSCNPCIIFTEPRRNTRLHVRAPLRRSPADRLKAKRGKERRRAPSVLRALQQFRDRYRADEQTPAAMFSERPPCGTNSRFLRFSLQVYQKTCVE